MKPHSRRLLEHLRLVAAPGRDPSLRALRAGPIAFSSAARTSGRSPSRCPRRPGSWTRLRLFRSSDPPVTDQGSPARRSPTAACAWGVLRPHRLVAAVRDQRQAVPFHLEGALAEHAVLARAERARRDRARAELQQLLVMREPGRRRAWSSRARIAGTALGQRIRDGLLKEAKRLNSLRRPLRTASPSSPWKVAEEQERLAAAPLLAHEEQRRRRREQLDGGQRLQLLFVGERDQPLAKRAVADLVVVLQEVDEARTAAGGRSARRAAPG